jgi:hypothetical protein
MTALRGEDGKWGDPLGAHPTANGRGDVSLYSIRGAPKHTKTDIFFCVSD